MLTFMADMKRTVNAFIRERNQRMSKYDLTSSQVDVLIFLLRRPKTQEVNQFMIQEGLGLSCPTVNGILNRLEKKGFIRSEQSQIDMRRKKIVLTKKGYQSDSILHPFGPEWEKAATQDFSEEEIVTLTELMKKIERNVKKMEDSSQSKKQ